LIAASEFAIQELDVGERNWHTRFMRNVTAKALLILFTMIGICLISCTKGVRSSPKDGAVIGPVYTNSYFGFSVLLPKEWAIASEESIKQVQNTGNKVVSKAGGKMVEGALEAAEPNIHYLLMLSEKPIGAPVEFNPSLIIMAEKVSYAPGIQSGKDYLFQMNQIMTAAKLPYEQNGQTEKVQIGGRTFHRADYTATLVGRTIRQSYISCVLNKYALTFLLSAGNDDQMKSLEGVVELVKFQQH
jgi:hypothetical protein